jgi:pyridinium-3,5-biscarboxylic acid mononucleotide synthase
MKPTSRQSSRRQPRRRTAAGTGLSIAHLARHVAGSSSVHVEGVAHVDVSRSERTAFPEIIFCPNKQVRQIVQIAEQLHVHTGLALGTRCPRDYFPKLRKAFPTGHFVPEAGAFRIGKPWAPRTRARVGLVSAGTTDIPVCEEAALILESLGIETRRIYDVGVAGIHRLFANDGRIRESDVLIVAAGMEGALPSVLGGLYPQPIIAVPTSNGYGTALAGFTPLLAMLTGCSPGVTVVNIDNGVGAAAAAFKIVNLFDRHANTSAASHGGKARQRS